jgi:hypothetical protein
VYVLFIEYGLLLFFDKAGNVAQSTKESCQQVKKIKLNRGLVFSEERTSSWFLKCFYVVCRLVSR